MKCFRFARYNNPSQFPRELSLDLEQDEASYREYRQFRGLQTVPKFTFLPAGEALQVMFWFISVPWFAYSVIFWGMRDVGGADVRGSHVQGPRQPGIPEKKLHPHRGGHLALAAAFARAGNKTNQ